VGAGAATMATMEGIQEIRAGDTVLAYVIPSSATASSTTFITPDEATFQAGFVVYPAGGEVVPHIHLPVRREVVGTSELLFVRSGRCYVDIYDADRRIVATRELGAGDAVLSMGGGHGFRMIEDTVLFELKQGPFIGGTEKVRFERPADISGDP
jgi:hypothetical protein